MAGRIEWQPSSSWTLLTAQTTSLYKIPSPSSHLLSIRTACCLHSKLCVSPLLSLGLRCGPEHGGHVLDVGS
eukprot:340629-Hanusia_phi.AAC.3